MSKILYPEHEKLAGAQDESQSIGMFLDWLMSTSRWKEEITNLGSIDEMLAAYFGIDLLKIEQEKRAMLEECRRSIKKEK